MQKYIDLENVYQNTISKLMIQLDYAEDIDILEHTLSFEGIPNEIWDDLIKIALIKLYN